MTSSKTKSKSFADKYEVFLIGEQLRLRMHADPSQLIRERKYYFRTYKTCFEGRSTLDWILGTKQLGNRNAALASMLVLNRHGVFHHVCDDHEIKDAYLFYRFRKDDGTHNEDPDMDIFFKGFDIFQKLKSDRMYHDIVQNREENGQVYKNVFTGRDVVSWMVARELMGSRWEAIYLCRDLLERDIIKHVTDDYHFRDNSLLYQFKFNYSSSRNLADVLNFKENVTTPDLGSSSTEVSKVVAGPHKKMSNAQNPLIKNKRWQNRRVSMPANFHVLSKSVVKQVEESERTSVHTGSLPQTESSLGLIQHETVNTATVDELEDSGRSFIKQTIYVERDAVGYGVVIRGDGPTFVRTIDPHGPGAAAGLKVSQYIYSVNGVNVLRMDHRTVAKLIMHQCVGVHLVVMTDTKNANIGNYKRPLPTTGD